MNEHLILDLNKQRIKVNVNRPTITRQGEVDAQTLNVQITLDGAPYDLTGCTVFFEALRGDGKKVIEEASITNALSGYISITLPAGLSLQHGHAQLAYFAICDADDSIITTESMEIVTLPGLCMFTDSDYIPYIERIIKELEAYLENVSEMEAAVTQIAEQAAQQASSVNQALAASSVATSDAEAATALAVEAVEDLDALKTELSQVKTNTEQAATSATTAATAANTAATSATTAAAAANSAAEDAQDAIEALQSADPFVEASVYINSSGTNQVVFENATDELGEKLGVVGKVFKLTIDGFFNSIDKIESIHFESTTYTKDIPIGMFDDKGVFKPGLKLTGYLNKGCFQVINPHDAASGTVLVPLFDISSSSSGGAMELSVTGSIMVGGDNYEIWDGIPKFDQPITEDDLALGSIVNITFKTSDSYSQVFFSDTSCCSIEYNPQPESGAFSVSISPQGASGSMVVGKMRLKTYKSYPFVVGQEMYGGKCLIPLWNWQEKDTGAQITSMSLADILSKIAFAGSSTSKLDSSYNHIIEFVKIADGKLLNMRFELRLASQHDLFNAINLELDALSDVLYPYYSGSGPAFSSSLMPISSHFWPLNDALNSTESFTCVTQFNGGKLNITIKGDSTLRQNTIYVFDITLLCRR